MLAERRGPSGPVGLPSAPGSHGLRGPSLRGGRLSPNGFFGLPEGLESGLGAGFSGEESLGGSPAASSANTCGPLPMGLIQPKFAIRPRNPLMPFSFMPIVIGFDAFEKQSLPPKNLC